MVISKKGVSPSGDLTIARVFVYSIIIALIVSFGIPYADRIYFNFNLSIESKLGEFQEILLHFCNSVYNQDPIKRWNEGCLLPFPKKGNLALTKNYRGITLTSIASKIYNLMLLNRIRPNIEDILRKNQNGFRTNRSTTGQILTIRRLIEGVKSKNLPAILLFIDFSKAFDIYIYIYCIAIRGLFGLISLVLFYFVYFSCITSQSEPIKLNSSFLAVIYISNLSIMIAY